MTGDCKNYQNYLPDLLFDPKAVPAAISTHLFGCDRCRSEVNELRATMLLMEEWTAPEPSAFFDSQLHARLRVEQAAAPEGFWERLTSFMRYSTGRVLRPAMAGALGVAMLLGGGTAVTVLVHQAAAPAVSSPTVNDLKIYDNNAQAVDQMDMLEDAGSPGDEAPQT